MTRRPVFSMLLSLMALAFVAASPARAQRDNDPLQGTFFEITGQVRLPDGRATANDIPISLELYGRGLIDQATTDSVGRFRFTRLKRGQYMVVVRIPGYREERQTADISVVGRAHLMIQLTADKSTHREAAAEVLDAGVPAEAKKEYERGRAAIVEKRSQKAVAHLEKAVEIYPQFFAAQMLLANLHMDESKWNEAETALRHALEIKPQTISALISLGEVHRRQKQFTKAEKVLQEVVKLDDAAWQGHFTLGRVYWEMGDMAKAGQHTGRTLQLQPDLAEAHLLGGNIFMRAGLPENALIEYEEYLRLAPKGEFSAQAQDIVGKLKKRLAEKKK